MRRLAIKYGGNQGIRDLPLTEPTQPAFGPDCAGYDHISSGKSAGREGLEAVPFLSQLVGSGLIA